MKIKGLKELQKKLNDMSKAAEDMSGETPIADLLTDSFLRKYTSFTSFEEFEKQSIFEKYSNFDDIPDSELDELISAKTNFSSWSDMLGKAAEEYTLKKLGF